MGMMQDEAVAARHTERAPLLDVRQLSKTFVLGKSLVKQALGQKPTLLRAVRGVDLQVYTGETLGLVGESGCGKTTLGRCILRLCEPDSGEINFREQNILDLKGPALRQMRRKIQVVFQDPYWSLNPRQTVGQMLAEACLVHAICPRREIPDRVQHLLATVGLDSDMAQRYPHELSGGQRQRVGLARALAVEPEFIVADEPVSALDVSIQAQVVNLLTELQERLHLTLLFITHDLRLVHYVSHRVAVMYLGRIVELGPSTEVFTHPIHPYTQALLRALPQINPRAKEKTPPIQGEPPSPIRLPSGCSFHPRCPEATERCRQEEPALTEIEPGHFVACYLP